ncbi:MAG: hypothetical protein R3E76_09285 [Planctomycetota bacterium]
MVLLILAATLACCGSDREYFFVFPEVNLVLLDESPEKVIVEKWYETDEGTKVFGRSEISGDKYVETKTDPATLRVLERSIARDSRESVTLVLVVRRGADVVEFRFAGTLMGNGNPEPVERSVRFD